MEACLSDNKHLNTAYCSFSVCLPAAQHLVEAGCVVWQHLYTTSSSFSGGCILRVSHVHGAKRQSWRRQSWLYHITSHLSRFRVSGKRLCLKEWQVSIWTLEMFMSENSPAQLFQVTQWSHSLVNSVDIQCILCTRHHDLGDGRWQLVQSCAEISPAVYNESGMVIWGKCTRGNWVTVSASLKKQGETGC